MGIESDLESRYRGPAKRAQVAGRTQGLFGEVVASTGPASGQATCRSPSQATSGHLGALLEQRLLLQTRAGTSNEQTGPGPGQGSPKRQHRLGPLANLQTFPSTQA
jgi:hypothetical protein